MYDNTTTTNSVGQNKHPVAQSAVGPQRPLHPDGIRGESLHTLDMLHSSINIVGQIKSILFGNDQEGYEYPSPDSSISAAIMVTTLTDELIMELRRIRDGLQG